MKQIILRNIIVISVLLFIIIYSCTDTTPTEPATNPYGGNNGKVSFFKKVNVNGGVTITIDTFHVVDTHYWSNDDPSCDNSSIASIILPPGTYTAHLSGQGVSCSYNNNIVVTSGQCKIINYNSCVGTGSNCDWNSAIGCISSNVQWGQHCGSPSSATVRITNNCSYAVKAYVWFHKTNGTWYGLPDGNFQQGIPPGGTSGEIWTCDVQELFVYAMPISMYVNNNCPWPPHP